MEIRKKYDIGFIYNFEFHQFQSRLAFEMYTKTINRDRIHSTRCCIERGMLRKEKNMNWKMKHNHKVVFFPVEKIILTWIQFLLIFKMDITAID